MPLAVNNLSGFWARSGAGVRWITPPDLGAVQLDADFAFQLDAEPDPVTFALVGPVLDGVTLDPVTGILRGRITAEPGTAPSWSTQPGSLGTFQEGQTVSAQLAASPGGTDVSVRFAALRPLPFGLFLSDGGLISGTVADLVPGEDPVPGPPPLWTTASGSLGTFQEGQAVSIQLAATPQGGDTSVTYALIGTLPIGLLFTPSGLISGAIADVVPGDEIAPGSPPTIITATLGPSPVNVPLGTITLAATAGASAIAGWSLVTSLPFGVLFSSGVLSGTPNRLGSYSVTALVFDVEGRTATRTWTWEIV